MSAGITKLQRWLDLIAFLVGRRYPVSVDEVFENVPAYAPALEAEDDTTRQSVRRMFERDKDEIRGYGIPIETVRFDVGGTEAGEGYRIARRDFYLPYLRLVGSAGGGKSGVASVEVRVEEARTAWRALHAALDLPAGPLQREVRSALRKISFDLDPALPDRPVTFAVDRPDADEVRARLRLLTDALLRRKRVAFTYHGIHRGETTERSVASYGLLFRMGNWYLVGHDALRDDVRVFRVSRMKSPTVNRKRPADPDYEIPATFDLSAYRDRESWELGGEDEAPVDARVRFDFPTSLWAERNGYGERIEELPDGSAIHLFQVRQVHPFLRWVLSHLGEARIVAPPELAAELQRLAAEVATMHRSDR